MFLFQSCCKNDRYRCYNLALKYTPLFIFFYLHFLRYYQKLFQRRPSPPPRSSLQKDATYFFFAFPLSPNRPIRYLLRSAWFLIFSFVVWRGSGVLSPATVFFFMSYNSTSNLGCENLIFSVL
jgi:hypothetical protein